jgi:hypothetical protein
MQKIFLSVLFLMLAFSQIVAQKTFKLRDYVPNEVVIEWQFKNNTKDGMSPIIVKNAEKTMFGKLQTVKRTENNGDYRLQNITNRGLEIYQLYFIGNRFIDYENPVVLMPNKLKIGEIYKSESPYKTTVNGQLTEKGKQTYEVKIERIEDVKTSWQTFKNCLVIRTTALRIDESGSQKGYELEEWYAKKIGAVKVIGTLYWKNKQGETTRTFKVDAELEGWKKS